VSFGRGQREIMGSLSLREEREGASTEEMEDYLFKQRMSIAVWHQWLTSVNLAIQEAEIRKIEVRSQPRQVVSKIISQKKPITKKGQCCGSKCCGTEFKPQYHKKQKQQQKNEYFQPSDVNLVF
jgi:hypothetical protein